MLLTVDAQLSSCPKLATKRLPPWFLCLISKALTEINRKVPIAILQVGLSMLRNNCLHRGSVVLFFFFFLLYRESWDESKRMMRARIRWSERREKIETGSSLRFWENNPKICEHGKGVLESETKTQPRYRSIYSRFWLQWCMKSLTRGSIIL